METTKVQLNCLRVGGTSFGWEYFTNYTVWYVTLSLIAARRTLISAKKMLRQLNYKDHYYPNQTETEARDMEVHISKSEKLVNFYIR